MNLATIMSTDIEYLARKLIECVSSTRYLLGVTGPPGSGKSTFSEQLVDRVNHRAPCRVAALVPADGFHLRNRELDRLGLRAVKGAPDTFDVEGIVDLLTRLRRPGAAASAPSYSRQIHEPVADAIPIGPHVRLIVVEGNYLMLNETPWDKIRPLLDETWYLDVDAQVCMARVQERHIRGGSTTEQARQKIDTNDRRNHDVVAATKDRADRVIHM